MIKPLQFQIDKSKTIKRKLNLYGLALFVGQVRSGKTAPFILAAQSKAKDSDILIITKKGAIAGVKKFAKNIEVTNYHQAKNITKKYKVVVLDECHRYIGGFPKRSTIWDGVFNITKDVDYIIFSSGTPTPETYANLFNMLALSLDSPWCKYENIKSRKTPYSLWHNDYGIKYDKSIGWDDKKKRPRTAIGWDKVKDDKVLADLKHITVNMTRVEAGHKFDAVDKLHYVPLTEMQEDLYIMLGKDGMYEMGFTHTVLADTSGKLLQKKHQVSGGYVNAVNDNNESETKIFEVQSNKVKYIKDNFYVNDTIILAFYISEQEALSKVFPNVGSITKNSDGVDYSHFKNMVIYSMGFPASTYEQVRGRQLNFMERKEEVIIHFLLSGIDEYVYKAVSNKQNFTASWYKDNKC